MSPSRSCSTRVAVVDMSPPRTRGCCGLPGRGLQPRFQKDRRIAGAFIGCVARPRPPIGTTSSGRMEASDAAWVFTVYADVCRQNVGRPFQGRRPTVWHAACHHGPGPPFDRTVDRIPAWPARAVPVPEHLPRDDHRPFPRQGRRVRIGRRHADRRDPDRDSGQARAAGPSALVVLLPVPLLDRLLGRAAVLRQPEERGAAADRAGAGRCRRRALPPSSASAPCSGSTRGWRSASCRAR